MKRYKITITFENGNQVKSNIMARSKSDAIKRFERTHKFEMAAEANGEIANVDVLHLDIKPMDNERFGVTTIDNKPGWYTVVDLDNLLKVEFKKHMYDETSNVSKIGEGKELTELGMETTLIEIRDYVHKNFRELAIRERFLKHEQGKKK